MERTVIATDAFMYTINNTQVYQIGNGVHRFITIIITLHLEFSTYWSQIAFTFLISTKDFKEVLFTWISDTDIYHISN